MPNERMSAAELHSNLRMFSGGDTVYRHGLVRNFRITEGIKYLAEHGQCYWLLDAISSYYVDPNFKAKLKADDRLNSIQFWLLEKADTGAVLKCQADTGPGEEVHVQQKIDTTDFPFNGDVFKVYVAYTMVGETPVYLALLPSEY